MNRSKGFTLIELMVVIAVIGILASIAAPLYQDYTRRSHIVEGLSLTAGARLAMAEYYSANGDWPNSNAEAGLSDDIVGTSVKSVSVDSGVISVTFNARVAEDAVLLMTGLNIDGSVTWSCTAGSNMQERWLPVSCR